MINGKAVIPQDMETTTRSFYFNIYKEEVFDPDFSPPGICMKYIGQFYFEVSYFLRIEAWVISNSIFLIQNAEDHFYAAIDKQFVENLYTIIQMRMMVFAVRRIGIQSYQSKIKQAA